MSNDASRRGASYSSAFAIILSLARRGGLSRLETHAAEVAIRRVREAAYPLIFKLFGSELPRGRERKLVLKRLGEDLARIEKNLGYRLRATPDDARGQSVKHAKPGRRRANVE
jgi:hypothetical protein